MSRGRPGTRQQREEPIDALIASILDCDSGPSFDIAALDRIAAWASQHIKPLTNPDCEWLKPK